MCEQLGAVHLPTCGSSTEQRWIWKEGLPRRGWKGCLKNLQGLIMLTQRRGRELLSLLKGRRNFPTFHLIREHREQSRGISDGSCSSLSCFVTLDVNAAPSEGSRSDQKRVPSTRPRYQMSIRWAPGDADVSVRVLFHLHCDSTGTMSGDFVLFSFFSLLVPDELGSKSTPCLTSHTGKWD